MVVKISSIANTGLDVIGIDVEVNLANRGLPNFEIVGLPSKAVEESRKRVKMAIENSGITFPLKKITVNLAPADVPKEGSYYDLPIAVGILSLAAGFKLPFESIFFGELSLNGNLRHTKGALLLALFAKEKGINSIFVPQDSANEAAIVKGVDVYPVNNLNQLLTFFYGQMPIKPVKHNSTNNIYACPESNMAEIIGQEQGKRVLEISASGGYNLFLVGSPGSGKTMLSRALPGILPDLTERESLEVTKIYSASGLIPPGGSMVKVRPFRSPHHTISTVGLVGGGSKPKAGEISLAHRGVLFLDELNEFSRAALEALRQPIEDGHLTISRSKGSVNYLAKFMLVASANPCPCGYLYHPKKNCICTQREVEKYRKKISGPLLDRIDMYLEVPVVDLKGLSQNYKIGISSEAVRANVVQARSIQLKRFQRDKIYVNGEMNNKQIRKYCYLSKDVDKLLLRGATAFQLSARSYFKVIRIARTIADLDSSQEINVQHMAEALQYQMKN